MTIARLENLKTGISVPADSTEREPTRREPVARLYSMVLMRLFPVFEL